MGLISRGQGGPWELDPLEEMMKMSLRDLAGVGVCVLMATLSSRLMAADEEAIYGIGEPWTAVPAAFRPSTAPADVAMTKKVEQALAQATGLTTSTDSIHVTTTADHIVYLRGFTQSQVDTQKIVSITIKAASPYKVKNDLRLDMFARPGPLNGPQDK